MLLQLTWGWLRNTQFSSYEAENVIVSKPSPFQTLRSVEY